MMYRTLLVDGIQPNTRQMVFTTAKAKFIVSLKKERRRRKKDGYYPRTFSKSDVIYILFLAAAQKK